MWTTPRFSKSLIWMTLRRPSQPIRDSRYWAWCSSPVQPTTCRHLVVEREGGWELSWLAFSKIAPVWCLLNSQAELEKREMRRSDNCQKYERREGRNCRTGFEGSLDAQISRLIQLKHLLIFDWNAISCHFLFLVLIILPIVIEKMHEWAAQNHLYFPPVSSVHNSCSYNFFIISSIFVVVQRGMSMSLLSSRCQHTLMFQLKHFLQHVQHTNEDIKKKKIDNELAGTQRQQVDTPNRFPICTACEL